MNLKKNMDLLDVNNDKMRSKEDNTEKMKLRKIEK